MIFYKFISGVRGCVSDRGVIVVIIMIRDISLAFGFDLIKGHDGWWGVVFTD